MQPGARAGSTTGRAGPHKAVHAVSTPQKTGRGKWWTLGVVGSGTFMSALDASVVNIALPVIGRDTGAGVSTLEWVILAYLITVTASVLVFGRLADIHGRRRIYMAGQLVFTLASLGCGLAGSIGWLIVARVIQAIGAAMIFALSPAILVAAFPRSERGRALGLQATLTYLGMALGPGLGGLLTQHFGWPFIFYINVPVGIVMWAVAYWSLSADQAEDEQPFDPAGAAGMAISLSALLFALSKGGEMGWRHPVIVTSMVVGILALAGLLIIESRLQHPALDLRLFANRRFSASIVAAWLCYICSASVSFLIPFLLISSMGLEASKAGLMMMAVPAAMLSVAALSGHLSDKVGVTLPATTGMLLMSVGISLLACCGVEQRRWLLAGLAVVGWGAGLFTAPNNSAIMGAAPRNRQGVAGAMLAAARTLGFSSGVALAGLIYTHHLGAGDAGEIMHAVRAALRVTAVAALLGAGFSLLRKHGQPGE